MNNLNEKEILDIFKDIFNYKAIESASIPDIDLYMDQVTTFIESKLNCLKRNDEDKMLTKTMINNYTKEGILFPSSLKKYTKDHIKMLVMIYYLKQVLSINDIKSLLKPISDKIKDKDKDNKSIQQKPGDTMKELYEVFIYMEDYERQNFNTALKDTIMKIENLKNDSEQQSTIFHMILDLVLQAQIRKMAAEKLIDKFFTHIND